MVLIFGRPVSVSAGANIHYVDQSAEAQVSSQLGLWNQCFDAVCTYAFNDSWDYPSFLRSLSGALSGALSGPHLVIPLSYWGPSLLTWAMTAWLRGRFGENGRPNLSPNGILLLDSVLNTICSKMRVSISADGEHRRWSSWRRNPV